MSIKQNTFFLYTAAETLKTNTKVLEEHLFYFLEREYGFSIPNYLNYNCKTNTFTCILVFFKHFFLFNCFLNYIYKRQPFAPEYWGHLLELLK